jgi:hypothetical protein
MSIKIISIATRRAWIARADPRFAADVLGNLTDAAGATIGCLVEDISVGGAKVSATERLLAFDLLKLTIPEYELTAPVRVIWTGDDNSGVAFSYGPKSAS